MPSYRGVTKHGQRFGWWNVRLKKHGKVYRLGSYRDPEYAARVYDAAAKHVHGTEAVLNFDGELPTGMLLADFKLLLKRKGLL